MTWILIVLSHVYMGLSPLAVPYRFPSEQSCKARVRTGRSKCRFSHRWLSMSASKHNRVIEPVYGKLYEKCWSST